MVGGGVAPAVDEKVQPKKRAVKASKPEPTPVVMPESIRIREDAPMWGLVFPLLTLAERAQVHLALETWDRFTSVFQRIKAASLADVRAMIKIRVEGVYTLQDLDDAINGIFVMASKPRGEWVYSSGAYLPRKLFTAGGKIEEARAMWAQVSGNKRSDRDDLGRMQHGSTDAELWGS